MNRNQIGDRFGAIPLAMDERFGQQLLSMEWPDRPVASQADLMAGMDIRVDRGQRFVIVRGVAIMPIRGMLTPDSEILEQYLGWATYSGIAQATAELAASDEVSAVILDVNSPGGMVLGMDGGAEAIAALAKVKPVYALANPLADSAAYCLASQATSIAMTPGSEVGSIGIMTLRSAPVQPDEDGNQKSVHVSSHARAKWPDPTTDRGLAEIKRQLDQAEAMFHAMIARGRGIPVGDLPARLSVTGDPEDGGCTYPPLDAIRIGLADTLETRAAFYDRIMSAHAPQIARPAARSMRARAAAAMAIAQN